MVKKGVTKVRLRKYFCMVLALMLVVSCLCITGGATEITGQMGTPIIMRASGKFEMDIPGHKLVKAKTSFPLEAGEQVTIKAAYSPFDANVDFGLITEDGIFHFLSVDSGSFDKTITVSERGNYTFAVRNNSSKTINVSGYVNMLSYIDEDSALTGGCSEALGYAGYAFEAKYITKKYPNLSLPVSGPSYTWDV